MIDTDAQSAREGAIETWSDFLRRGDATPLRSSTPRRRRSAPPMSGRSSSRPAPRACPRGSSTRIGPSRSNGGAGLGSWACGDDVRSWTANGFFWSGNFSMVIGCTLSSGGAIVLQPTFRGRGGARADAGGAGDLALRVATSMGEAGGGAQLEHGGSQQRALCRRGHALGAASDGPRRRGRAARVRHDRDADDQHCVPSSTPADTDGRQLRRAAAREHAEDRRSRDRRGGAARRARRDRRQGPDLDAGLRRHPEGRDARRRTASSTPATAAISTRRGGSTGRAAYRTSSRPAAPTSRRERSTRCSRPIRASG